MYLFQTSNIFLVRRITSVSVSGQLRAVVGDADPTDLYGRLYDNIFLRGHVVEGENTNKGPDTSKHNFVPGYLAMFL